MQTLNLYQLKFTASVTDISICMTDKRKTFLEDRHFGV